MSLAKPWATADGVALRKLLNTVGEDRLRQHLLSLNPAKITSEIVLEKPADTVARLAIMKEGYEQAVERFIALADDRKPKSEDSGHQDMS